MSFSLEVIGLSLSRARSEPASWVGIVQTLKSAGQHEQTMKTLLFSWTEMNLCCVSCGGVGMMMMMMEER